MNRHIHILTAILCSIIVCPTCAMDYPSLSGETASSVNNHRYVLANRAIEVEWTIQTGRIATTTLKNKYSGHAISLKSGQMPRVVLGDGRIVDLAELPPVNPETIDGDTLSVDFKDDASGLTIRWSATLDGTAHYLIQSIELTASRDTKVAELVFVDASIESAKQIEQVDGSVVVCDDIFLAVEHPLARNIVTNDSQVRCALPRGNFLSAGQTWRYSSVIGAVRSGQLRRDFLSYLERRRARPYRPFLHYNNWYDVTLARPSERVTEPECLAAIEFFGRELVRSRGVKLDAFVWDDGWDDFNTLWDFHKGFPDGFMTLKDAAGKYGAAQGVWMSPWGGYARAKNLRIAYGKSQGYETNDSGFSMAGAKYGKAFRDVCLHMMREHGVVFFKFDGMGGGNETTGARAEMADDVDAVLNLTRTLRRENPDVFISATIGTWASPFWTLYADSIWRQGGDTGFYGQGDTRQQWITYRDKYCYERIVQLGPLYPLNSLMLHGPCISDRRNPSRMVRGEKSVANEIWSFFGSGTNLQELYITPRVMTSNMWDQLAAAAKWSRDNSDVLVDTHWIGGDPAKEEVYGWAAWQPKKGIVTLRNPGGKSQTFTLYLASALELPESHITDFTLKVIRGNRSLDQTSITPSEPIQIELAPFEVLVLEAAPVTD